MIKSTSLCFVFVAVFVTLISSCKVRHKPDFLYGTFKFKQKTDEVFIKSEFSDFVKENPYCSFVLRVPSETKDLLVEENFVQRSMYFALEKKLVQSYFNVHDRTLVDFKSEKELKTDFILEMVNFKNVNYFTNKVIPEGNAEDKEVGLSNVFYFVGAQAQFKIINVKTNEIVATFVLNYTPCLKGCRMQYTADGNHIEEVSGDFKERKRNGYQSVDIDDNFVMFEELAQRLIFEMKKPRK